MDGGLNGAKESQLPISKNVKVKKACDRAITVIQLLLFFATKIYGHPFICNYLLLLFTNHYYAPTMSTIKPVYPRDPKFVAVV